jgi:hypothetical protein
MPLSDIDVNLIAFKITQVMINTTHAGLDTKKAAYAAFSNTQNGQLVRVRDPRW